MSINLPKGLQEEAEALAKREGVDLETVVVQAVEYFLLHKQDRAIQARRRLRELNKQKFAPKTDLVTEVRLARAWATQLYPGEEELRQLQLQTVAEKRADYSNDMGNADEAIS